MMIACTTCVHPAAPGSGASPAMRLPALGTRAVRPAASRCGGLRTAGLLALVLPLALALVGGCAAQGSALPSNLPTADAPFPPAETSFVWVGTGRASVNVDGQWRRVPAQDYEFSVTQRRYAGHWESIKTQHRRHPDYDGSAGPRDQSQYFRVDFKGEAQRPVRDYRLTTSFGDGGGTIDAAFTSGRMAFAARDVSRFAPFDRYRIDQSYRYREGRLVETVELLRRSDSGAETVFMRFDEQASLFAPGAVIVGAEGSVRRP